MCNNTVLCDKACTSQINALTFDGITEEQKEELGRRGSLDLIVDFIVDDAKQRFRVNIFLTRGRCATAAQRVSNEILDLEDPIEYLFSDAKGMFSQREVGIGVPDFPTALRARAVLNAKPHLFSMVHEPN